MMALQLKNGDAPYYQSADYCRNYTSPPVSYGDSSHYLARLPGKERLAIQNVPSDCQQSFALIVQGWRKSSQRNVQMRKVDVATGCPGDAVIIIMSCRGVAPAIILFSLQSMNAAMPNLRLSRYPNDLLCGKRPPERLQVCADV